MTNRERHTANDRDQRIIIIGAGPGGLCMAIKLLAAGHHNFIILEKAAGVGGTWWHNRYPGAACDVPSHLYSYSFEIKRDWSSPYATAPEILNYIEECARKYDVLPYVRLNCEVNKAVWLEQFSCWRVTTAGGEIFEGAVLVAAQGMFNELSWPILPGLEHFGGTYFHTARWNHNHDLTGKRVGVIGSAASAVQCVPAIAPRVDQLTLFQRTPNWVLPKKDRPYSPEKLAFFVNTPEAVEQNRARLWQEFEGFVLLNDVERYQQSVAAGLANIALVDDPVVRRKLTPHYSFGCKRVLLSSNYYQTFNRENVQVITDNIQRVTATGVITSDGAEHALDTLILATGFNVTRYLSSVHVIGREGRVLAEEWNEGAQAYLGITTAGFPNLFQIYGPNTNKGSILYMIECQVDYIVRQIARLQREQLTWIDVRPEVMAEYNVGIQTDANNISVWAEKCNNYFRHPTSGRVVTQYPRNMGQYYSDTLGSDLGAYFVSR
jgi:cation diffusion facilitator CzcD-associated flavoprotein CzcO